MQVKKLVITSQGVAVAMWDDRLPLLQIGHVTTVRASSVEFDEPSQMWVARSAEDNRIIAASRNRDECIAQEVVALQVRL